MPICPKCKQEYEEGFKECADCLVPLVDPGDANGESTEEEKEEGQPQFAAFRGESEEVLDLMTRAVAVHHIPTECATEIPSLGMKGHLLIVPAPMAEQVAQVLDRGVPELIGEGEGNDRIYRFYQPGEEEEIRDPELLRHPLWTLQERGEEIIDELIEIVARGDQAARHRAAYVLSNFGDKGIMALIKLLKVAIEKEKADMAVSLIRVIRQEVDTGYGWEEFTPYLEASKTSRILSLQALSALGNEEAFPSVLPLLRDEDPDVRDEADNTLCTLADEDMGFDTQATAEDRERIIEKWESWWTGRNHG